jgi:hypothetical protein
MGIALSPQQALEIFKCRQSPEYFIETYGWLEQQASAGVSSTSSIIPFQLGKTPDEPFYFQREILRWLHDRQKIVTLKSRRVGCSWIAAAYTAWLLNFHKGVKVLFISRKETESKKILAKVRFILKNLALHDHSSHHRATKASWLAGNFHTDAQLTFSIGWRDDNGEITMRSTAESVTTTDDSGRGDDATFTVFDELAFYEHPDETWASAQATMARGGHWFVISTPSGVGDIFHRLCARGDLSELGKLQEPLGYLYRKIHWSEAGITKEQIEASTIEYTSDKREQEWEWKFIAPGSVVFDPAHLAACYKPLHEHPELVEYLEDYREKVLAGVAGYKYYSGVDTIRGKSHRKSREKDWNSFSVLTKDNVQAFHYYDQSEISQWAGKLVDNAAGGRMEIEGKTSKLHKEWPGTAAIEETGVGLTTATNHQIPNDNISEQVSVDISSLKKRNLVERMILKVEAHTITITDPWTYQCMMVFQRGDSPGKYEAPPGYYDDPVDSLCLASNEVDKESALYFDFGNAGQKRQEPIDVAHPYQDGSEKLPDGPRFSMDIRPENQRMMDLVLPDAPVEMTPLNRRGDRIEEYLERELEETDGSMSTPRLP